MEITQRIVDGLTILRVRGQLAATSEGTELETFRSALAEVIACGCVNLAINLEAVKLLDARGLGELADAFTRLARRGGRLTLIAPAGRLRELLRLTRLDSVLPLFASEQEAIECFRTPPRALVWQYLATALEPVLG